MEITIHLGRKTASCRDRIETLFSILSFLIIIQHLLELLMIQSDKLAYLTDLSGSRGRTSGETALSAHSEEHEVF